LWQGERFDDGGPRARRHPAAHEARGHRGGLVGAWTAGYERQFEGNWLQLHPGRVLVGRAVTGVFVPHRPDLHDTLMDYGNEQEGRIGAMNSWVIETWSRTTSSSSTCSARSTRAPTPAPTSPPPSRHAPAPAR
jgi:hypothetical protein